MDRQLFLIEVMWFAASTVGGVLVGDTYYVDSVAGSDSPGRGSTYDAPLATISSALELCDAKKRDTIILISRGGENPAEEAGQAMDEEGDLQERG